MPLSSAKQLVEAVRQSRLVADDKLRECLKKVAAQAGPEEPTAVQLAKQLLQMGLLTTYQVKQLLAGRTEGFFFGDYKILDRIGKGSMGKVYKAMDLRLGRPVALKVLKREFSETPKLVARFKREGAVSARLEHPRIVRTYNLGQWRDLHYIVFEYVDGTNLKAVLARRGRLPPCEAIDIALQVAEALDYAHRHGVVHRDLKPSNILLSRDTGEVKILDMGLARLESPDGVAEEVAQITRVGEIVGTFDYLAPEQAEDTSSADVRSDLYSLGCTFYHMVTGRPPFPEGTVIEKLEHHRRTPPTPPSQLVPDLPAVLDRIILKLLAKAPEDRYQRPLDLIGDLAPLASMASSTRQRPLTVSGLSAGGEATLAADPPSSSVVPGQGSSLPSAPSSHSAAGRPAWRPGLRVWIAAGAIGLALLLVIFHLMGVW